MLKYYLLGLHQRLQAESEIRNLRPKPFIPMRNIKHLLEQEGYTNVKIIEGRGWCGLSRMIFTTGLCYEIDEYGYGGRYCFEHYNDAVEALNNWDGNGDPAGDWIKHKGKIEYSNPNNQ